MTASTWRLLETVLCVIGVVALLAAAVDWPMWRHDAGRTGVSYESIPEKLNLKWMRKLPSLVPAFPQERQERVQFDLSYEPVVMGKLVFICSSRDDSIVALDTESGDEKWRVYSDGPMRFAPVAWDGRVYAGSDDGRLYCLSAEDGRLLWKLRGAPSNRKVIGNGRLISLWPVRGGPVIADGIVYFAAGVWPFDGIFVCAADARTGRLLWVNDTTGVMYLKHPHEAPSFGGPSPMGYLLLRGDELVMPSGRAFPASFERRSGRLTHFDFGFAGHGQRIFSVRLQGSEVLKDFDIARSAGGADRGVIRQFQGVTVKDELRIDFEAKTAQPPLICGVEMIAER